MPLSSMCLSGDCTWNWVNFFWSIINLKTRNLVWAPKITLYDFRFQFLFKVSVSARSVLHDIITLNKPLQWVASVWGHEGGCALYHKQHDCEQNVAQGVFGRDGHLPLAPQATSCSWPQSCLCKVGKEIIGLHKGLSQGARDPWKMWWCEGRQN